MSEPIDQIRTPEFPDRPRSEIIEMEKDVISDAKASGTESPS